MKPTVIVVGADKGGVGKTTVSRLVHDYLTQNGFGVKAYDTEFPHGGLKRFHPATEVIDLTKSIDQMRVFDNLSPTEVSLIDVRAGLLTPSIQELSDIGLFELAKAGNLRIIVLHIVGPAAQSLEEVAPLVAKLAGARHVVVANHINDTEYAVPEGSINIGKLDEQAAKAVDEAGQPFFGYANAGASFVLKGKVRKWMSDAFAQFDAAKLNVLS